MTVYREVVSSITGNVVYQAVLWNRDRQDDSGGRNEWSNRQDVLNPTPTSGSSLNRPGCRGGVHPPDPLFEITYLCRNRLYTC